MKQWILIAVAQGAWLAAGAAVAEPWLLEPLGRFRVTYYWVAEEDERYDALERSEPLLDRQGRVLARVSRAFRQAIELEGTGRLRDGRVLNVAGRVAGELRFVEILEPYGLGVESRPLEPFISVAADLSALGVGDRLRIEEFAGFLRPDGRVHDGMFRVDDTGSAIRGKRIDVFIGDRVHLESMERLVCPSHGLVSVYAARPAGGGRLARSGSGRELGQAAAEAR